MAKSPADDPTIDPHATDPMKLGDNEKAHKEIERRMRLTGNEQLRCKALLEAKGVKVIELIKEGMNLILNLPGQDVAKAKAALQAEGYEIYKSTVNGQEGYILFEAKGDQK
jgi:hypothetical protein